MPTSYREQVLAAVFSKLSGLAHFASRRRNHINLLDPKVDYPALVMMDGGDDAEPMDANGRDLLRMRVDVAVAVLTKTSAELGPALSEARAQVLKALGADPTLGGLVSQVRYRGATDPDYADQLGQPAEAVMTLTFLIDAPESAADPYL